MSKRSIANALSRFETAVAPYFLLPLPRSECTSSCPYTQQHRSFASYSVPLNRYSGKKLKQASREIDRFQVDRIGSELPNEKQDEEEQAGQLGRSRGRRDRADSLSSEILADRSAHLKRISETIVEAKAATARLEDLGFGQKKSKNQIYGDFSKSGAGGHAVHVGSARTAFPVFRHLLPEIVLAGHTNSGKSTLVNSLAGIHPSKGPASVSDRAGWTDLICFYQIGKRPPVLTLVDVPGYGHAVADQAARTEWNQMTREYLRSRRLIIARCCVLVDCTRGLCREDRDFIRSVYKLQVPVQIILTKADLLSAEQLANSISITRSEVSVIIKDLEQEALRLFHSAKFGADPPRIWGDRVILPPESLVVPASSATGAGVQAVWHSVCDAARRCAQTTSSTGAPLPPNAVREHIAANRIRREMLTISVRQTT